MGVIANLKSRLFRLAGFTLSGWITAGVGRESAGYRFGRFIVDIRKSALMRDGEPIPLAPKPFDLLVALIEHRGQVLSKERLLDLVWPETAVSESTLFAAVSRVRTALDEVPGRPRYIRTTPKRGYSFIAPIQVS